MSVITMTFNRPAALRRCLESLAGQTLPGDCFELVVVDVSTEPATATLEPFRKTLRINHLCGANLGVAGNRNCGARKAHGEWLAFIDDDCVAHADWLERLVAAARAHPDCLVGGSVQNMHPQNAIACAGQVITEAVDTCFNPVAREPTFLPGLNFAINRDAFLAVGGNDETFGRLAAEDREFAARWRQSGRRLVKAEDAIVTHEHRSDLAGYMRQYFNYGKGAWRYYALRRARGERTLDEATRLHLGLWRHVQPSLRQLPPVMRVKVILLLFAWEIANAGGFCWQAGSEMLVNRARQPG